MSLTYAYDGLMEFFHCWESGSNVVLMSLNTEVSMPARQGKKNPNRKEGHILKEANYK